MAEMNSKRARVIAYAAPAIFLIGCAVLFVTFPEIAGRLAIAFEVIVVTVGIMFVAGGLYRRDPSLLLVGAGFLIEMSGDYYSTHWVIRLGVFVSFGGILWMIRRHASRPRAA